MFERPPLQVHLAQRLLKEHQHREALRVLAALIKHHPDDGLLWEMKGAALHAIGQIHSALYSLEMATTLAPVSFPGQVILADCYTRQGRSESAQCIYDFLVERVRELPAELLPRLAAALGERGDVRSALTVCRRAVELLPDSDEAAFGLAYYLGKAGYPPESVRPLLQQAFKLAPDKFRYRIALAHVTEQCGEVQGAYRLVAQLNEEEVAQIACRCCSQRLLDIYAAAGDERRRNWCRARLQVLNRELH
jgi:predicted Zn-dependent protease